MHTKAGAACETCYGPVRERAVITQEVANDMRSCMACHAASKARTDCGACREERCCPFLRLVLDESTPERLLQRSDDQGTRNGVIGYHAKANLTHHPVLGPLASMCLFMLINSALLAGLCWFISWLEG